jgi:tetratricopeptide (TPR) repeat protein
MALSLLSLAVALAGSQALGADTGGASPEFDALVRQAEAAEARLDPESALQLYLRALGERPNDTQVLLKVAKQYSDSTLGISDPQENRRRMEKALMYSQRAAAIDPRNDVALLSEAICYGKLGLYSDIREKIEYSKLVKRYAEEALSANPNCAYAHHVLGQWEYEVASLGRTKRFLIALIYGAMPPASTEEAVRQLETAVSLEPNVASHHLALGFAYRANGEEAKAREQFRQVMDMPVRELYDEDCHRQATRAIASL